VERSVGLATWRFRARITVRAPAAAVAARMPSGVVVSSVDADTCVADVGSDSARMLAAWIGLLDADFSVEDCPELAEQVRVLAERYRRAAG
jgi:hypothetical protein